MDTLRFIINQLNKDFGRDYNMISFDSLSNTELIQVLVDVLVVLNATQEIEVQKNEEQAIMNIMLALQSMKYVPEADVPSSEFREGLIMGRRNVVHPILHWILSNKDKVKQRIYFANFVEKVAIPPELQSDVEIEQNNKIYDKLIEDFWTTYNENAKEKKNAAESTELQEDTKKMSADMSNLLQRLEMQGDKLKNVPNRETVINSVQSYRNELKQKEKLEEQLTEQKNVLVTMASEIKSLHASWNYNQGRRPNNVDPIKQLREELHINQILVDGQLPQERNDILLELKAFEKVAQESEPSQKEIDGFSLQMDELNQKVQTLLNNKITLTNTNDDQLMPFRNQATIIANRKQELSNFIMKVKNQNETLTESMNQKLGTLRELVGGDVLHGDELKAFISNLRERSVVYKAKRAHLQGLQASVGILTRTKEILWQEDPTVENSVNQRKTEQVENDDLQGDDVSELKYKCKMLYQDANSKRMQSERVYDELLQLRSDVNNFTDLFYEAKREFDNATGNLTGDIERLEQGFEELEMKIQSDEGEWKDIRKNIESYEIIIQKYSDEIASSLGSVQIVERLNEQLRSIDKNVKKVRSQLEKAELLKNVEQDELEQYHRIKQMLLFKIEQI